MQQTAGTAPFGWVLCNQTLGQLKVEIGGMQCGNLMKNRDCNLMWRTVSAIIRGLITCRGGGTGRRAGLKIRCRKA